MHDLTGQKFGKLTVIGQNDYEIRGYTSWRCRCDCGEERVVVGVALRTGKRKSCGCGSRQRNQETAAEANARKEAEKASGYDSWKRMVKDCRPEGKHGKRGIRCDDRWAESFDAFIEDMGPKPDPKAWLRRYDANLGFRKDNCYWEPWDSVADKLGAREERVLPNGKTWTIEGVAGVKGVSIYTVKHWLKRGDTEADIASGRSMQWDEEEKAKRKAAKQEVK